MGYVIKGINESYFNCNPTYFLLKLQGVLCKSDIHCTYLYRWNNCRFNI